MTVIDTSNFLQADDIEKVMLVPCAVHNGHHTDDAMENYIGVDSNGRQGRYYRLAAEKLGLVELIRNNHTILTPIGQNFVTFNKSQQDQYMDSAIRNLPVFAAAIQFTQSQTPPPSQSQLKQWFINLYPGEQNTAERRFYTFINYLRFCGFQY